VFSSAIALTFGFRPEQREIQHMAKGRCRQMNLPAFIHVGSATLAALSGLAHYRGDFGGQRGSQPTGQTTRSPSAPKATVPRWKRPKSVIIGPSNLFFVLDQSLQAPFYSSSDRRNATIEIERSYSNWPSGSMLLEPTSSGVIPARSNPGQSCESQNRRGPIQTKKENARPKANSQRSI